MYSDVVQTILYVMLTILFQLDTNNALRCWHCIADNCDIEPKDNYNVTETECNEGGYCQKVIYTDRYKNMTNPTSIVKSCTKRCIPENNTHNCTENKRGCVIKLCCQDSDFCNSGESWRNKYYLLSLSSITSMIWRIWMFG